MNKNLSKEITKRTFLRKNFLKDRKTKEATAYHLQELRYKKVTDKETFWRTIKPFLSDKIVSTKRIILIADDEVVLTEQDTAHVFNTFFLI